MASRMQACGRKDCGVKTGSKDGRAKVSGKAANAGVRNPAAFPPEEDILAFAPEGWTNYVRQLGTDFIAQVSIYNEVLSYLDARVEAVVRPELPVSRIGPNRVNWLPAHRVLSLDNVALGVCWLFWINTDWEPMQPDASGLHVKHRMLELADVQACIKVMSPAAYAEHLQWEMDRSKH